MKRRILSAVIAIALCMLMTAGCGKITDSDDGKISIVTTIFPAYDFARGAAGDLADLTLLLPPGSEVHSFEPTPQDLIEISECDLFIYNGGESDEWVEEILESLDQSKVRILRMMDCVETVEEEEKEGMYIRGEEEDGEEWDEHVWTSPYNAAQITASIGELLCQIDPDNAQQYSDQSGSYAGALLELDAQFSEAVSMASGAELVFADRFPARYFTERYGLDYYAAYPGCSEESEPSAKTVAFLIDKVREERIPYVLYIEFSNEKMADTIMEDTGCGKLLFHSCHNVTKDQFENGTTYLELMRGNLETIRKALEICQ